MAIFVRVPLHRGSRELVYVPSDHPDLIYTANGSTFFRGSQVGWNGNFQYSTTDTSDASSVPAPLTKVERWAPSASKGLFRDLQIPAKAVRSIVENKRVIPKLGIAERMTIYNLKVGKSIFEYSNGSYRVM